ncbi:hypothetical protein L3Y34_002688 [Caenorhabditis briggsae]|uniref:Calpain catalytic domain-containing protein n=1 Tax=Caenorhabditis briggsae TaxID=6238 RepID=A0AAE9DGZ3_CAEBR|nr:hypothetical protein L3Y34_002688 [Caenorhabditis briggsae]
MMPFLLAMSPRRDPSDRPTGGASNEENSENRYQKNQKNQLPSDGFSGGDGIKMADDEEEIIQKIEVKPDEFNGLIGSIAGNLIRDKVGGPGGDILGGLASNFFGGGGGGGGGGGFGGGNGGFGGGSNSGGGFGGNSNNDNQGKRKRDMAKDLIGGIFDNVVNRKGKRDQDNNGFGGQNYGGGGGGNNYGGGGGNQGGGGFGDILGGLLGGGGQRGGGGGGQNYGGGGGNYGGGGGNQGGGGGGFNLNDIGGIINSMGGGGGGGQKQGGGGFGDILGGIGSLIGGGGGGQYNGGGGNVNPNRLNGGMVNIIGNLIGEAAHRFLGVDPSTGRIIGAVAGNVIMGLGGKDNSLGNIGKVILDNIISGKFRRDVDPFVRPGPDPDRGGGGQGPSPIAPRPTTEPQDFYELRDQCLQNKQLFEDPQFQPVDSSLFFSKRPPKRVEWLRPGEIVREPQLITEGHSRFDVIQGELGDCWLLAAAANLTLKDELFYRVVPPDQSFTENYAGIFHFQFWQYGKWVDVVIDDRLPTSNGELLYMHSASNNEFWSALLEKAYAKLFGSYEALKGGTTSEALEDMTGGLTEFIDLKNPPRNLMQMMMRGFEMGSLFGCSIEADPNVWEAKMSNGLVKGHAYSITGCRIVDGPNGQTCILRIRNPWGNEQEWNGAWSDNSREWRNVPDSVKQDMGLKFDHDGEFWMSFEDYMRNFEKMEICNLGPDVMDEVYQMTGVKAAGMVWAANNHDGAWIRNQTAGGCRNYINTFANNPQFRVQLTDSDPDDDDELCTVIFAVMQKYRRNLKQDGLDNVPIGFAVYDMNNAGGSRGRLSKQFFAANKSAMRSAAFINLREMTGRFRVPPGNYVIVPSTFEPNEEAEFMLRVYTNGFIESEEL